MSTTELQMVWCLLDIVKLERQFDWWKKVFNGLFLLETSLFFFFVFPSLDFWMFHSKSSVLTYLGKEWLTLCTQNSSPMFCTAPCKMLLCTSSHLRAVTSLWQHGISSSWFQWIFMLESNLLFQQIILKSTKPWSSRRGYKIYPMCT